MSSILKSSLRLLFEESNVCMCEGGREKETSKDRERKTHTHRERERERENGLEGEREWLLGAILGDYRLHNGGLGWGAG